MTKYTDFINYHLSMLVDDVRTGVYSQAISRVVKAGDVVADVGCGAVSYTHLTLPTKA